MEVPGLEPGQDKVLEALTLCAPQRILCLRLIQLYRQNESLKGPHPIEVVRLGGKAAPRLPERFFSLQAFEHPSDMTFWNCRRARELEGFLGHGRACFCPRANAGDRP